MPQIPNVPDKTNATATNSNSSKGANQKYTAPEYRKTAFHCPHCEVYSNQRGCHISEYDPDFLAAGMFNYIKINYNYRQLDKAVIIEILSQLKEMFYKFYINNAEFSFCDHCKKYSIWVNQKIVYPHLSTAPLPVAEMPESVKELYDEARVILNQSPRGACALLRLAIQFLVKELGEKEKNLNTAIGNLVKKGLPQKIQESLDSVRVIGNNAVHPGEINIKDNPKMADSLFMLVNFISEKMITEDKKVDAIYSSLPENKIEAINKRDNRMDVNE